MLGGRPSGYGEVPESEAVRAVQRAVDLGVSFFDTADSYGLGRAERILGKALAGRRGQVVLATKAGWVPDGMEGWLADLSADHIRAAAERSRRRLQVDVIDLFQLHGAPEAGSATDQALDALDELKTRGITRLIGASVGFDVDGGRRLLRTGRIDALRFTACCAGAAPLLEEAGRRGSASWSRRRSRTAFSPVATRATRFPEDDWRADSRRVAARVERAGRMRFLGGEGRRTLLAAAILFVLAHPAVTAATPGFRNLEQVEG
jgi:aryl-alcohol dehydrogenase-like predicted oxidoreductase